MTHIGVDNDPEHLVLGAVRAALADGWGGSMIATDVSDILFGAPRPVRSRVNLGVLKQDEVNLIVHGHEPTLSDVIVAAARDPELLAEAEAAGAKGINLAGICCTANEILMRHGVPIAGNFLQQELAIIDGSRGRDAGRRSVHLSRDRRIAEVFPHEGHLHEPEGQVPGRDPHRVPRGGGDGDGQTDRPSGDRKLRAAGRDPGEYPRRAGKADRRVHHGSRLRDPRRAVPAQLPAVERRHPGGAAARSRGRGRLQQSQVPARRIPLGDGQRADS